MAFGYYQIFGDEKYKRIFCIEKFEDTQIYRYLFTVIGADYFKAEGNSDQKMLMFFI
jgi:hypothetical protein